MLSTSVMYAVVAVLLIASALSISAQRLAASAYGECDTPDGNRGTCIRLQNCTSLLNLLRKKPLRNEERLFLVRSRCGSTANGNVLVCCRAPHIAAQLPQAITYGSQASMVKVYGECITPNEKRAVCIQLEQCTSVYNLLKKDPLLDEDKKFLRRSQCGSDNNKILVCCSDNHIVMQQSRQNTRGLLPEPGICGNTMSTRIYGGSLTMIDEFPWMALLMYELGDQIKCNCAGSLINDRYVLTAAHCIPNVRGFLRLVGVRLGEWDTSTDPDCKKDSRGFEECAEPHVEIPIESTIISRNYKLDISQNQPNDIALLRLSRKVIYTDFIQPICLPIRDNLKNISLNGIAMDIAGWGFTENGTVSNIKRKGVVHGISCQEAYGAYYRERGVQLEDSQICAGGENGIDACRGDSGGPLIALDSSDNKRIYQYIAGIVSFGSTCGSQGGPGVYTKVSSYIDWILQNIEP